MAAILIPEQYYINKGYVDGTLGPYADITALNNISNRFVGLTVTVLSPTLMECWLKSTLKSGWRIKRLSSVSTYAELLSVSATIFSEKKNMMEKGVEATVISDETNEGKTTKYIVSNITDEKFIWERQNAFDGIPITGDDVELQ